MADPLAHPRVGVGVLIRRGRQLLLGRRRGSHGEGTWSPPGGHLELFETPEVCAAREAWEETGLKLERLTRGPYTNDFFRADGKHYVTLFVLAQCGDGEPENREPQKCDGWEWFSTEALPSPLFAPLEHVLAENPDLLRQLA